MKTQESILSPSEKASEEELDQSRDLLEHVASAFIQERVNCLRADILKKLAGHGVTGESGWALFSLGIEDDEDIVDTVSNDPKEVLLIFGTGLNAKRIDDHPIPDIRVLTCEPFGLYQFLTEDLVLSDKGKVLYFVDAAHIGDSDSAKALYKRMANPLFGIREGELALSKMLVGIDYHGKSIEDEELSEPMLPFGTTRSFNDIVFAIEAGQAIFESTKELEPLVTSLTI